MLGDVPKPGLIVLTLPGFLWNWYHFDQSKSFWDEFQGWPMPDYQHGYLPLTCPLGRQGKVKKTWYTSLWLEQPALLVEHMWVSITQQKWPAWTLTISIYKVEDITVFCKYACFTKYWLKTGLCLLQAYQTIKGDKKRYQERIDEIASRPHKAATKEPAVTIQSEPSGEWFNLEGIT